MSILAFILRALALSLPVFLRFLPFAILYGLIIAGLLLSTENPWVIGMIMFLLGTYGYAFLVVTGIRGGLVVLKVTTPPTGGGLLNSTTRVLFFHLLLQLILAVILLAGIYALFVYVIGPAMAPVGMAEFTTSLGAEDPELAPQLSEQAVAELALPAILLNLSVIAALGFVIGIFGVPMAAVSANAVHHSPQNDMIYGLARYLPHQMILYIIAMLLPSVGLALFAPVILFVPAEAMLATLGTLGIMLLIYTVYAPCISYAGMALGYKLHRDELARIRAAEARPEIDYEAERENLKALRQTRKTAATGTKIYDPKKARSAPRGTD